MTLIKLVFNMIWVYGKYKDLPDKTQSDKVLRKKAFEIAYSLKYDGYHRGLALMVYKSFDKKSEVSGLNFTLNQVLANELHNPIIKKFKRRKVYSSFKANTTKEIGFYNV